MLQDSVRHVRLDSTLIKPPQLSSLALLVLRRHNALEEHNGALELAIGEAARLLLSSFLASTLLLVLGV